MKKAELDGKRIKSVKYYPKTQEMIVKHKGGERIFFGVPQGLFDEFKKTEEPDSFYGNFVVLSYPSRKVQPSAMTITVDLGDPPKTETEDDEIDFSFFNVGGSNE